MDEFETGDVVATYPQPDSPDDFWLFMVTSLEKKILVGQWLQQQDDLVYRLEKRDFFVLKKLNMMEGEYMI